MGIPLSIESLLHSNVVESSRIEFKEGFQPTPIVHSICAFANDIDNIGGGYIVMGIAEEDGMPVYPPKGLEPNEIDKTLKELRRICHFIRPVYEPVIEPVEFEGKMLILIWCPGGNGRPYIAPEDAVDKKSHKYPYIRKFSSSSKATDEETKELYYISSMIPYDDRECVLAGLDDLDRNEILDFLKQIGSSMLPEAESMTTCELASSMRLLSGPPEHEVPVNAAVLFFSRDPQKFFRGSYIEVVWIPDPTGEGRRERKFTGPIHRQLMHALDYIQQMYLEEEITKLDEQAEAVHTWNYPYRAVEEILSNAVYHRDYGRCDPVTVRITPENLSVTSYPEFYRSITQKDAEDQDLHAKFYRNRRIGDFLKELKLIEGRNTGFPNARKALAANGSDPLEIDMDEDRSYVTVTLPVHPAFLPAGETLSPYQISILEHLKKSPSTLTQLSKAMGYKGITAKLKKNVEDLKKCRRIVVILDEFDHPKYAAADPN